MNGTLRPTYRADTTADAGPTNVAPSVDLPPVLDPAVFLLPADESVSEDLRKVVREWVYARVLEGLEAEELAAAETEPTDYERHRADYRQGRHVAEQARNGYQWPFGKKWAETAMAALDFSMTPGTSGHRFLCHDALQAVVRAYEVHEARMAGCFTDEVPAAMRWPTVPFAAPMAAMARKSAGTESSAVHEHANQKMKAPPIARCLPPANGPAAPEAGEKELPSSSSDGRGLQTLDEAFEKTRKKKEVKGQKEGWHNEKTPSQARRSLEFFKIFSGLTHIHQVRRNHVQEYTNFLIDVPRLNGKSIYSNKNIVQQVELCREMERLRNRARNGDKAAKRRIAEHLKGSSNTIDQVCEKLAAKTINRYLSQLGAIFPKPVDEDGLVSRQHPAFQSVQFSIDKSKRGQITPTRALKVEEYEVIFGTEKFQVEFRRRSERFWALLLMGLNGIRRGECAQLEPESFNFSETIPTMRLDFATMTLKRESCERTLPIHPLAIELGLEEFVRTARKNKQKYLFPSLDWKDTEMERGRSLTRWFTRVLEEAGIKEPGKILKSLRNGFNTDLTRGWHNDAARHYLMGHKHEGVNLEHYFGGFRPEDVAESIVNTEFAEAVRRCLLGTGRPPSSMVRLSPSSDASEPRAARRLVLNQETFSVDVLAATNDYAHLTNHQR